MFISEGDNLSMFSILKNKTYGLFNGDVIIFDIIFLVWSCRVCSFYFTKKKYVTHGLPKLIGLLVMLWCIFVVGCFDVCSLVGQFFYTCSVWINFWILQLILACNF